MEAKQLIIMSYMKNNCLQYIFKKTVKIEGKIDLGLKIRYNSDMHWWIFGLKMQYGGHEITCIIRTIGDTFSEKYN